VHRNLETILRSIHHIRGSNPTAIQAFFRAELARLNDGSCRAARDNGAIPIDIEPAFNGTTGTKAATSLTPGAKVPRRRCWTTTIFTPHNTVTR
jgi:hypothetical protein